MLPSGFLILYNGLPRMKITEMIVSQNDKMIASRNIKLSLHLLTAMIIRMAGTPKASGKQVFWSKHFTSSRRIGVMKVEIKDPALIAK